MYACVYVQNQSMFAVWCDVVWYGMAWYICLKICNVWMYACMYVCMVWLGMAEHVMAWHVMYVMNVVYVMNVMYVMYV